MKTNRLQIRISEDEKAALAELANELDRPAAQIVREAITDKLLAPRPRKKKRPVRSVETA